MTTRTLTDPVMARFRAALDALYGERLERAVLFGSRARGDDRPDSDYDVAVFIHRPGGFLDELKRLADAETEILLDTGAVIYAMPFPAGAYADATPFMHDVRRDGVDL